MADHAVDFDDDDEIDDGLTPMYVPGKDEPEDTDDIQVVVEDDTPAKDRGRSLAPDDSEDEIVEEDELAKYSDDVKKRINKLTRKANDERRAKESKERELREAQVVIQNLRTRTAEVEAVGGKKEAEAELATLKKQLANAIEEGDSETQAELQEKIAEAKIRVMTSEHTIRQVEQAKEQTVNQPREDQGLSDTAQKWVYKNSDWFNKDTVMTGAVYGIHQKLIVEEGVAPDTKQYYTEIDKRMREYFPNYDWGDSAPKQRKPSGPPVGPVVRNAPGGKKIVRLTESQRALCRRIGISEKEYAAELVKMQRGDDNV